MTYHQPTREKLPSAEEQLFSDRLDGVLAHVKAEIMRAKAKHPGDFHGPHEAYGILLEEVDELWDEIKADHYDGRAQKEAIQVAAMAVRYVMEIPIR